MIEKERLPKEAIYQEPKLNFIQFLLSLFTTKPKIYERGYIKQVDTSDTPLVTPLQESLNTTKPLRKKKKRTKNKGGSIFQQTYKG